jgi:hypothetical protein
VIEQYKADTGGLTHLKYETDSSKFGTFKDQDSNLKLTMLDSEHKCISTNRVIHNMQ